MVHIRPNLICVSVCVKLQSHCWVCDETKQAILIVDLADFLVGTHKSICEHVTWKHRWVIGDTILIHGCFTFFTPLCKDVQLVRFQGTFCYVTCRNIRTKQDMVTFELPYAHDKRSQIPRQKRVSVLVAAQARWHFCSLRHTLRACVWGKHECLCSILWINVVPALIFF